MKQSRNDQVAWTKVAPQLQPGAEFDGTVSSLVNFGAFVEVSDGIEGLVHNSESDRPLAVGDRVRVRVIAVDDESRRLSLSTK